MVTAIAAGVALIAYLTGSINTSVILSKSFYGEDVRDSGSGNAGATNMLRTYGAGIAVLTLICDVLKGALLVLLANWLDILLTAYMKTSPMTDFERNYLFGNLKYIAGFFVVFGHDFPIWFGFRGGKGVATSLGVILALNWKIGLILLVIAILIMAFSRYVSLGSVTAAVVYPFMVLTYILAGEEDLNKNITYLVMALLLALLLIIKHHTNIKRLKNGTESKLFAKKPAEDDEDTGSDEDEEYEEEYAEDKDDDDDDEEE